jgi:hypothetical protein
VTPEFGAFPFGVAEATLGVVVWTACPASPDDVAEEGAVLICAELLGTKKAGSTSRLKSAHGTEMERRTAT